MHHDCGVRFWAAEAFPTTELAVSPGKSLIGIGQMESSKVGVMHSIGLTSVTGGEVGLGEECELRLWQTWCVYSISLFGRAASVIIYSRLCTCSRIDNSTLNVRKTCP
jgi:hypothetical protein